MELKRFLLADYLLFQLFSRAQVTAPNYFEEIVSIGVDEKAERICYGVGPKVSEGPAAGWNSIGLLKLQYQLKSLCSHVISVSIGLDDKKENWIAG